MTAVRLCLEDGIPLSPSCGAPTWNLGRQAKDTFGLCAYLSWAFCSRLASACHAVIVFRFATGQPHWLSRFCGLQLGHPIGCHGSVACRWQFAGFLYNVMSQFLLFSKPLYPTCLPTDRSSTLLMFLLWRAPVRKPNQDSMRSRPEIWNRGKEIADHF